MAETSGCTLEDFSFLPIGFISSAFSQKTGTPRQASICPDTLQARLKIDKRFFTNPQHSLEGLKDFSHVWLTFVFSENGRDSSGRWNFSAKIRPPRLNGKTVGVFATRSPHRPNPIGLSLVRLIDVEDDTLLLGGVDLVDGTPVLDIKPYIAAYDAPPSGKTSEASWVSRVSEIEGVSFTSDALVSLSQFHNAKSHHESGQELCPFCMTSLESNSAAQQAIAALIRTDLRSVYRKERCSDRVQFLSVDSLHVTCWYNEDNGQALIMRIKPLSQANLPSKDKSTR